MFSFTTKIRSNSTHTHTTDIDCRMTTKNIREKSAILPLVTPDIMPMGTLMSSTNTAEIRETQMVAGRRWAITSSTGELYRVECPRYDADTICQRVTSRVRQGSIVLFHNAALHTPEALPAILTCLINDGYTVVPISQLILPQPYTIDHTGRQFPAETGA